MMKFLVIRSLVFCLLLLGGGVAARAETADERPEWGAFFAAAEARGTMVVADRRGGGHRLWRYDAERAARRYVPASTFKIAHALMALESGVLRDEFQVLPWDGVQRAIPAWNRDQDLRSSMRASVVWVYQGFARQIGEARARRLLQAMDYGNAEPSGGEDGYWLDGKLRISAEEQVAFLERLFHNQLPLALAHQRLVKDVMIVEAGRDWILRAKTGWDGRIGWWVGWVEWPQGPVFFAPNLDTPGRMADLPKREGVARAILAAIGALPAAAPVLPGGASGANASGAMTGAVSPTPPGTALPGK